METNNNNGAQDAQPSAVKPIWEVIGADTDAVTTITPAATEVNIQTEDTTATETVVEQPKTEEVKTETPKTEEKPAATTEAPKAEDATETLELTAADIKDAPKSYEDGTFQALGQHFNLDVPEESFDALMKAHNEKYILKDELQKLVLSSKEELYKTLSPELATAFELIDLGVPAQLALNPTKEHDEWLAKDSAEVVRAKLMNQYQGDEEVVDAKMEELSAEPHKLEVQAKIIKADINAEKQQILNEQQQIANKYREQSQQAELKRKAEADAQFEKALAEEQAFLGLNLSKEYKENVLKKYRSGAYKEILSPAQAQVRAIILLESGDKFAKTALSKAKEQGKAEIVEKLSDVKPRPNQGGSRQQVVTVDNNQESKSPFANMPFLHT